MQHKLYNVTGTCLIGLKFSLEIIKVMSIKFFILIGRQKYKLHTYTKISLPFHVTISHITKVNVPQGITSQPSVLR